MPQIIAVITPYMVNTNEANLKAKVFFVWGSLCFICLVYAYFLIPETKVCFLHTTLATLAKS